MSIETAKYALELMSYVNACLNLRAEYVRMMQMRAIKETCPSVRNDVATPHHPVQSQRNQPDAKSRQNAG